MIEPSIRVETITPESAARYLSTQELNRNINLTRVTEYVRRILNEEWRLGDAIKFDINGKLYDGQHRLTAVIKAGKPVDFTIVEGMPTEAKEVTDLGQSRTVAHIAKLKGVNLTARHLSIIKAFMRPSEKAKPLSPQVYLELYAEHQDGIEFAIKNIIRGRGCPSTALPYAALAKAYYYENHERLLEFGQAYGTGYSRLPDTDDAALAIRNHIIGMSENRILGSTHHGRNSLVMTTCKYIQLFCQKKVQRKVVEISKDNIYPLPRFIDPTDGELIKIIRRKINILDSSFL